MDSPTPERRVDEIRAGLRRLKRSATSKPPADGQTLILGENELRQDAVVELSSPQGALKLVLEPRGTRGYDDLRRGASREYLGRGLCLLPWRLSATVTSPNGG